MIIDALSRLYDRLNADGTVPPPGFSNEKIGLAIVLDRKGRPTGIEPLLTAGPKKRATAMHVPQGARRTSNVKANFLWGSTAFTLGLRTDPTGEPEPSHRNETDVFRALHVNLLKTARDPGLRAVLAYCQKHLDNSNTKVPVDPELLNRNAVFKVQTETGWTFAHETAEAQEIWRRQANDGETLSGTCLATGREDANIVRLHPVIKNILGAPISGAMLVSFNMKAFESQGHKQGENAPLSEEAAFRYGTSLNHLLSRENGLRLVVGDTTIVYWADAEADRENARRAETLIAKLLNPPAKADPAVPAMWELVEGLAKEDTRRQALDGLDAETRFHVLAMTPNMSRITVRLHVDTSVGHLAATLADHWLDLKLENQPADRALPLWLLAAEARPTHGKQAVPKPITTALISAALRGTRYPPALTNWLLTRLRSDQTLTRTRLAMLKAAMQRAARLSGEKEDNLMTLDATSTNTAYLLGRLFAVFTYAETAVANRKTPLTRNWMTTASSSPRRAFGVLLTGFRANLTRLGSGEGRKRGSLMRADKIAGEILALIPGPGQLPRHLTPEDQTRFHIGYYHQDTALYTKAETPETDTPSGKDAR